MWEALIRLDVGALMVFVSGDIQYVKWRKLDQTHVSLRLFCFPGRARVCPSAGEFLSIATRWRPWLICWFSQHLNI